MRDRSWGPRPTGPIPEDKKLPPGTLKRENRPVRANQPHSVGYVFGTQDEREAFLAFTDPWLKENGEVTDDLDAGYLLRDGEYAPIVAGFRTIELASDTKFIRAIQLEATDALGRELSATGELVSRHSERFAPPGWLEALDTA